MKRLTADEVIKKANLALDKVYMQTDTGVTATGAEWIKTIKSLDPEFDSAFDPEGDGAHLVALKSCKDCGEQMNIYERDIPSYDGVTVRHDVPFWFCTKCKEYKGGVVFIDGQFA